MSEEGQDDYLRELYADGFRFSRAPSVSNLETYESLLTSEIGRDAFWNEVDAKYDPFREEEKPPPGGGGGGAVANNDNAYDNKFKDVMNALNPPGIGPPRSSDPRNFHFNIDDPVMEGKWETASIDLKIQETERTPHTCEETCAEKAKKRRKNCAVLRKRVAESLKSAGCPSRVIAYKQTSKCHK